MNASETGSLPVAHCGRYRGPVFDFHTHLRVNLRGFPGGQPVPCCQQQIVDPLAGWLRTTIFRLFECSGYRYLVKRGSPLEKPTERILSRILRSFPPGGSEELVAILDQHAVAKAVVLALPPLATNEAILALCSREPRLVPFVSPVSRDDPVAELETLFAAGARGIKLHPVIQGFALTESFVGKIARWAAERRAPVMIHAGGSPVLFGGRESRFCDPRDFATLAAAVPEAKLIIAHVGLWEYPEILQVAPAHLNLHVDISFQSTAVMRQAVDALGCGRVLVGSDHPFGNIGIVLGNLAAAGFSADILANICWKNAQRLLGEAPGSP